MVRKQWAVAGAGGLGYVVLTLVGVSIGGRVPDLGTGPDAVATDFSGGALGSTYAATYVTGLAAFAFLVLAAFLAASMRRDDQGGLSAMVLATGTTFALLFGLDAVLLTALRYAGHHGADTGSLVVLNTVRTIALDGAYIALGAFTLAASAAILRGVLPRWLGWIGLVVGVALLVVPVSAPAYLLSLVWTVAAAIVMLTRRPSVQAAAADAVTA
jgi:hypothetical protein